MALGNLKAPVTVIEYASVGCPHCATWAINVFPGFKAKYIDTGRVRFVFREMLTGQPTLAAAGFLTARCAGPARYFDIVDQIFRAQNEMVQAGDAYGPLLRIAKGAGLTSDQFDSCMKDHAALSALEARSDRNGQENGISGTPTFVIGDRKLEGDQSLESLGAAVASAEHR
jgi:protein-disulfide isomerase